MSSKHKMVEDLSTETLSSPKTVVVAALQIAFMAGTVVGAILALWIAALNGWSSVLDTGVLFLWLAALYSFFYAMILGGAGVFSLVLGQRPTGRFFGALALAFTVFFNGLQRFSSAGQLLTDTRHLTALGGLSLLILGLVFLFVFIGAESRRPKTKWGGLLIAFVFLALLNSASLRVETPRRLDLTTKVPEALRAVEKSQSPVTLVDSAVGDLVSVDSAGLPDPSLAATKLVVLGFDGLSWDVLLPLLREGVLPGFSEMLETGGYGYLETYPDALNYGRPYPVPSHAETISPTVWETISTGRSPRSHGIGYHNYVDFPGVGSQLRHLPTFYRGNSPMALRRLLAALSLRGAPWKVVAFDATDSLVARFYEAAEKNGRRVGLCGWMNTGPAMPVAGFLRGFGPRPPKTYPSEFQEAFRRLPARNMPSHGDLASTESRARFEAAQLEVYLDMARQRPVDLLLYYTHFHDASNHVNWKNEAFGDRTFFAGIEHQDFDPGPHTRVSVGFFDQVLQKLSRLLPTDATLVVVSDHGFDWRGLKHHNGPPGVFLARGPGIQPGLFAGASIYDVAPTVLHLLGLPVADDMEGETLTDLFVPGGPYDHSPERIATYGAAIRPKVVGEADAEELRLQAEELRALGYVN